MAQFRFTKLTNNSPAIMWLYLLTFLFSNLCVLCKLLRWSEDFMLLLYTGTHAQSNVIQFDSSAINPTFVPLKWFSLHLQCQRSIDSTKVLKGLWTVVSTFIHIHAGHRILETPLSVTQSSTAAIYRLKNDHRVESASQFWNYTRSVSQGMAIWVNQSFGT